LLGYCKICAVFEGYFFKAIEEIDQCGLSLILVLDASRIIQDQILILNPAYISLGFQDYPNPYLRNICGWQYA